MLKLMRMDSRWRNKLLDPAEQTVRTLTKSFHCISCGRRQQRVTEDESKSPEIATDVIQQPLLSVKGMKNLSTIERGHLEAELVFKHQCVFDIALSKVVPISVTAKCSTSESTDGRVSPNYT